MISKVSKDRIYKFSAWLAVSVLALGGFGYGYCVATIQAQAARAIEISINQAAYHAALDAKDKLISSLAQTTVDAAGQAADAVATAAIATSDAADDTKAAAIATKKADNRQLHTAKPVVKPAAKKAGSAKAEEWTQ